jgi:hypothetical protein
MEGKQLNTFWSQKGFLNVSIRQNLSLKRNRKTMVLDHTFFIWIYNIVMFH